MIGDFNTDESLVCNEAQQCQYVWTKVGSCSACIYKKRAGIWFSLIPEISLDGVLKVIVQDGTMSCLDFEFHLDNVLVSQKSLFICMYICTYAHVLCLMKIVLIF
jgi:hypothetical protein